MLVLKSGPRPCRDDEEERSDSAKKDYRDVSFVVSLRISGGTALPPVEKHALALSSEFKRALSRVLAFKSSRLVTINDLLFKVFGKAFV